MSGEVDALMSAAMQAHQAGNLVAAEEGYRRVAQRYPAHSNALMYLGVLRFNKGDSASGEQMLRAAVRSDSGNAQAWTHLGNLLLNKPDLEGARAAFTAATEASAATALTWLNLGGCLWRMDEAGGAEAALRRALSLDPRYEVAFSILTLLLNRQGRVAEAAEVYRQWHAHHPANPLAKHMLAATTGVEAPARAAPDYIRHHFDRIALDFDQHLGALGYRGPDLILEQLRARLAPEAKLDVLDAGCGTGLCGPLLRPVARHLSGVDLSPGMIAKARERGVYDELVVAEICEFMRGRQQSFDAVACIETLNYFGDLDEPLRAARACLRTGGLLALTVESLDVERPYRLEPHGRYLHSFAYLQQSLSDAGFVDPVIRTEVLRRERGTDAMGHVCVARAAPLTS
jgi:predicted TPR repeat methyltransferase